MTDNSRDDDQDDHHAYLERAYGEHKKSLYGRAYRLSNGRSHEAEDLVHETFCRALIYCMDPEVIRNPRGYLLRMMRNIWIDKGTKEKKVPTESLDSILSDPAQQKAHPTVDPEILRIMENDDLLKQLKEISGALTRAERRLLGAYLSGQTLEEIADDSKEDLCRTRYRWYQLKAKLGRLIKARDTKVKGAGRS